MSPLIKHPKRRGEWVELQFMARATSHDLVCSKPWGDSCAYDNVTDYRGLFNRIQIKSSSYRSRSPRGQFYGYPCNTRPPSRRNTYAGKIDFFAFYLVPEDLWYIIPISALRPGRSTCAIHLNPHNPRSFYSKYLEAWHLLKKK